MKGRGKFISDALIGKLGSNIFTCARCDCGLRWLQPLNWKSITLRLWDFIFTFMSAQNVVNLCSAGAKFKSLG
jgi:hypothetical protein